MDTKPPNTSHEDNLKESNRAATPGVSNDVGKLSLDDDQPTEHKKNVDDEVQIVGEVAHLSDDDKPRVRKNRKPTQRKK